MADNSKISWTTHTWNLWWGCEHADADAPAPWMRETAPVLGNLAQPAIAEECRNCYAESWDHRLGGEHWGPSAEPKWASEEYWGKLRKWNARAEKLGERHRVFVSSMADWAQRHRVPHINAKMDHLRSRLFSEISRCTALDFLLLTKRAERLPELLPWMNLAFPDARGPFGRAADPWPHVWVGVTCGTRRSLWRVAMLRAIPAAVRFISGEPLLDNITGAEWDLALCPERENPEAGGDIHLLIVGDESGSKRRPTDHESVATARDAAARNRVAFHLKQLHIDDRKVHLPVFQGKVHDALPAGLVPRAEPADVEHVDELGGEAGGP